MAEITNTSITRSEMLLRKQQIELTRAGYDLLDKKRLALLQQILDLQDEVVRLAAELERLTADSRQVISQAELIIGEAGVRSAAMGRKHAINLDLKQTQIMGVRVPSINRHPRDLEEPYDRDLGIIGTSPAIDETAAAFHANIAGIIALADSEMQFSVLTNEIQKTTRRLKALEHIIIPRLEAEYRAIRNALEERERSEHFALKLAKRLVDRRNQRAK